MTGMKDTLGDTLFSPRIFHGETYDHARDYERLSKQARRVAEQMADGQYHTLHQISAATGDPEASISARLRDLRRAGFNVEREYVENGLWKYRIGRATKS